MMLLVLLGRSLIFPGSRPVLRLAVGRLRRRPATITPTRREEMRHRAERDEKVALVSFTVMVCQRSWKKEF